MLLGTRIKMQPRRLLFPPYNIHKDTNIPLT
jgi:hypothetical protein